MCFFFLRAQKYNYFAYTPTFIDFFYWISSKTFVARRLAPILK